jgi:CO/xanthine dehydrogenase Mo-binding subunit
MRGAYFRHFNAPTFHVHLAEVQIDPDTGRVQILRYVVAQDVGRAVNPAGIEGQIHGGVAQGIGYALFENIRLADGRVLESDLEAYRLPGALDVPRIEAILLEHPDPAGPYGAKGAGEPPIVPVAAAIANAVSDAIGRPIDRLPITPFDVLAALRGEGRSVTEEGHRRVVRSAG